MSRQEIEQLIARAVDGTIDPDDANRLAKFAEKNPDLIEEIHSHLKVADLIDQHLDPSRNGEAFLNSMQTRFRAERESAKFIQATVDKIKESDSARTHFSFVAYAWVASILLAAGIWMGIRVALETAPKNSAQETVATIAGRVEQCEFSMVHRLLPSKESNQQSSEILTRIALEKGMMLQVGDRIVTQKRGHLHFVLNDNQTLISLEEEAILSIGLPAEKNSSALTSPLNTNTFNLIKGHLVSKAAPRPKTNPLTIFSPHAKIEVTGTKFSLHVTKNKSSLEVQEGSVRMKALTGDSWQDVKTDQCAIAQTGQKDLLRPSKTIQSIDLRGLFIKHDTTRILAATFADSTLCILSDHGKKLHLYNPENRRFLKKVTLEHELAKYLSWDGSLLWGVEKTGRRFTQTLFGIDLKTGRTVKRIQLPARIQKIQTVADFKEIYRYGITYCFGGGHLWIGHQRTIFQLQPETGQIIKEFKIQSIHGEPKIHSQLFYADGWLYTGWERNEIYKINPANGQVAATILTKQNLPLVYLLPNSSTSFWAFERSSNRALIQVSLESATPAQASTPSPLQESGQ